MKVEWDDEKESLNLRKHKLRFYMILGVFYDVNRIERFDVIHSMFEDRYVTIGKSDYLGDIVFVVYCVREDCIRIISARIANDEERSDYYDRKIRN